MWPGLVPPEAEVVLDEEGHGLLTDFGLSKDGAGTLRLDGRRVGCRE